MEENVDDVDDGGVMDDVEEMHSRRAGKGTVENAGDSDLDLDKEDDDEDDNGMTITKVVTATKTPRISTGDSEQCVTTPESGTFQNQQDATEMFRKQEVENGNGIDWGAERNKVEQFCKWQLFNMIKFPTEAMLCHSVKKENMTEEDKHAEIGLMCQLVVGTCATAMRNKPEWWMRVKSACIRAFGRRRSAVTDAVKKIYISKYIGRKGSVCVIGTKCNKKALTHLPPILFDTRKTTGE